MRFVRIGTVGGGAVMALIGLTAAAAVASGAPTSAHAPNAVRVHTAGSGAAPSGVAPPNTPECPGYGGIDFTGIPGTTDFAIGIPGGTVSGLAAAGSMEIRYGCGTALGPQNIALPTPHAGDRFGAASVAADVNNDGFDDLLVGVPDYDVGSATDAGAVAVFSGSSTGLHYSRLLVQGASGVPGVPQAGDHFGAALSTGAVQDGETSHTVRVGEPGHDVGSQRGAGGFVDLVWNAAGAVVASGTAEVTLDSGGIPGAAATGDALGSSLWQLSAVGAPGKSVAGQAGAGAVLEMYRGVSTLVTQDSPCMAGTAEAGDHFGAAVAGAWIGVPGEDIGTVVDAGVTQRWDPSGDASRCYAISQNTPGVDGTAEAGDQFGASLVELYAYDDGDTYDPDMLVIGVPGEDVTGAADSGMVNVEREFYDSDTDTFSIAAYGSAVGEYPGPRAGFGTAITAYDGGVLIGAPDAFGEGLVYAYDFVGRDHGVQFTHAYEQLTGTKVKYTFGATLSQDAL